MSGTVFTTLARMAEPPNRAAADVSLDQIRDMLGSAVRERHPEDDVWLSEVFPGYLVFERGEKFFRAGWSILDGAAQLGEEETEVEKTWVETRSAQAEADETMEAPVRLEGALDPEGTAWDVTVCRPGFTRNGWFLDEEVLRSGAGLFEGVDVNLYDLPQGAAHVPAPLFTIKPKLARNKVGWIDNVRFVAGEGIKGVLHFLDSAKWLGRNLVEAAKQGVTAYGLSYDCAVRARMDVIEGRRVFRLIEFLSADSVDVVTRPAAGGKFNRAVAAQDNQEETMDWKEKLYNQVKAARPDLLEGRAVADVSDEEMIDLAKEAMTPAEPVADPAADEPARAQAAQYPEAPKTLTQEDLDKFRCQMSLDTALEKSDLPEQSQNRVRGLLGDKVFKPDELQRAIAAEKDFIAGIEKSVNVREGVPFGQVAVGIGTIERATMALDKAFGLTQDDMIWSANHTRLDGLPFFDGMLSRQDYQDSYADVPAFGGLLEIYATFTGDPEVSGRFDRNRLPADMRASADITSTTFAYALGNTLHRRLIKDYREANFQEDLLISIRKPVKDFKLQEAVAVGYFSDLDDVDPESGDYQEIAAVTDEEATYKITQKGNILTVTRKTIKNDDISVVQRLLGRVGRAARRTFAKFVWGLAINNANCSDGTAWFTVAHGNLFSDAMDFASAISLYLALAKMVEKDSGEPIGLLDDPNVKPTLIYPTDMMVMGEKIVEDEYYYTANDLTTKTRNPLKGKIKGARVSLLPDVNDWMMIMPTDVIDVAEIGFLDGRQEPEFFVAEGPTSERGFMADEWRYKVRHEYNGTPIDPRSGCKSVVV
jgi:hypothetical protein